MMSDRQKILLDVQNLKQYFPIKRGLMQVSKGYVKAIDGVSFHIRDGETLGLVGESGCGKTTTGRCILRVIEPTAGKVVFRHAGEEIVMTELGRRQLKDLRKNMQMIFQDPYASLNPRMTIMEIIGEPLTIHGIARGRELEGRVSQVLLQVGLKTEHLRRYPHSFSGGQRQRIGIARALILNPKLVICDEPVSALDVSIQAQIINLLQDLQEEFSLTYLFIAHDMSVVKHICVRIAVMYVGKLVELAPTKELIRNPKHPYTEALLSAVPRPNPHYRSSRIIMSGETPDPSNPAPGCTFHPRCRYAKDVCKGETPALVPVADNHYASCHFADELSLSGI